MKTLGVLGAGVMGAGIAYVSAVAGIDVVLIDTTIEKANAGRDHAAGNHRPADREGPFHAGKEGGDSGPHQTDRRISRT